MESISTKINDSDAAKLAELFESKYDGAKTAIEAFLALRVSALSEVRNLGLQQKEIISIVDSLNGTMSSDARMQANVSVFVAHMEDFESLESGISRHGANASELIEKVKKLSSAQVYFLQDEIYRWWQNQKPAELTEFVKLFQK